MRRAPRLDENHKQVVEGLVKSGCFVQSLAGLGNGAPDLFVAYRCYSCLLEIKTDKGKLTEPQIAWFAKYFAQGGKDLFIARSEAEARERVLGGHLRLQRLGMCRCHLPVEQVE